MDRRIKMPSLKEFVGNNVFRLQRKLITEGSLLSPKNRKRLSIDREEITLPNPVWSKVFDHCSPFDLYAWRRVNKNFKQLIDSRFNNILYLDVYKADVNAICEEKEPFWRHRSAQILMQSDVHSATLIVHDRWTSRDVIRLFAAIRTFSSSVHTVAMDACIVELIAAGLSSMDLNRWFAFQCYLRTLDCDVEEESVHVQCVPKQRDRPLFPKLKEFSIRIGEKEYPSLSRMLDYEVSAETLFSIGAVQLFRVCLRNGQKTLGGSDGCATKKRMSRHLRTFKRWIGADALRERYCQQYCS